MATTTADLPHPAHDDHHHDHPKFLAHHFETPEQQYDSGKLGVWLFLVTEILFFSGMFCAYALFRAARPDVFAYSSEFLNTTLGAINTCVLLFSSLTMAWAVRASQLGQHKTLAGMLTATLCCASIFLGVKAIEYSHKWGIGLNPGYLYSYGTDHATSDLPFLTYLCVVPAICLVGTFIWYVASIVSGDTFARKVAGPLVLVSAAFFAGVGLGTILESGGHHGDEHGSSDAHVALAVGEHSEETHGELAHTADGKPHTADGVVDIAVHSDEPTTGTYVEVAKDSGLTTVPAAGEAAVPLDAKVDSDLLTADPNQTRVLEQLAKDKANSGVRGELEALETQLALAGAESGDYTVPVAESSLDTQYEASKNRYASTFFGIYYCMTGVHAIHILAGMAVLIWLLVRAVREDFNRQYFGPVDYVGLYWHLVDLIWIYLFPLLYLIR